MIRSDARALIRHANATESNIGHARFAETTTVGDLRDWKALTRAERKLAASICDAVLGNVAIDIIERDVIAPTLAQAVLVGSTAREAIGRALSIAGRV